MALEVETPWGEFVNEKNPFGKNSVRWIGKTKEGFWQTTHAQCIYWDNPNPGQFTANISNKGEGYKATKYNAISFSKSVELRAIDGKIEPGDTQHLASIDSPNIIDGSYFSSEVIDCLVEDVGDQTSPEKAIQEDKTVNALYEESDAKWVDVDAEGTEWKEDKNGDFWYRTPGMEWDCILRV